MNDFHSHYINNENQFQLYFSFLFIPYKKAQMTIQSPVLFYYFLKIPNGFPTGKTTFPKCVFNTAAAEP